MSAAPDFPWTCRDADAVLSAAWQYSFNKTPLGRWDTRKIFQARKEYDQCLEQAEDDEDRVKALRGLTSVWRAVALRDDIIATNTNLLKTNEAARRRFFRLTKNDAVAEYRLAQKCGRLAIEIASRNGIEIGDFANWLQRSVSDPLAQLDATAFENLKSRSALTVGNASLKPAPPKMVVPGTTVVHSAARSVLETQQCARPNVPATTLRAVEPDMPAVAQKQGIQGTVQLIVSLDADSNVTNAKILSSPSEVLMAAALSATYQSKFQTEIRDCKPIAADYVFSVDFQSQ